MSSEIGETRNIKAVMIIEMLGRPPEHIVESMENIIKNIEAENGTRVISKSIKEPKEIENSNGIHSTFAEVEVEVEEILTLALLMFKYMPSNIEIIHPETISLTNNSWSEVLSEIVRRLHSYDEIARVLQIEKAKLEHKLKELSESAPASKKTPNKKQKRPKKS